MLMNLNHMAAKYSTRYPQYGVYIYSGNGPTFGGGHDLSVQNNMYNAYCSAHSFNAPGGRDAQPALVIGRHYITERDSAPVQYNGVV